MKTNISSTNDIRKTDIISMRNMRLMVLIFSMLLLLIGVFFMAEPCYAADTGITTITTNTTWNSNTVIGENATIAIPAGVTLTINGSVTLNNGSKIVGEGTIARGGTGAYIVVAAGAGPSNKVNTTISGITIDGQNIEGIAPIITLNEKYCSMTLNNVTITNACSKNANHASAILLADTDTTLYLTGNTTITGNGKGKSAINLATESSECVLDGNIRVYDNLIDGNQKNIMFSSSYNLFVGENFVNTSKIGIVLSIEDIENYVGNIFISPRLASFSCAPFSNCFLLDNSNIFALAPIEENHKSLGIAYKINEIMLSDIEIPEQSESAVTSLENATVTSIMPPTGVDFEITNIVWTTSDGAIFDDAFDYNTEYILKATISAISSAVFQNSAVVYINDNDTTASDIEIKSTSQVMISKSFMTEKKSMAQALLDGDFEIGITDYDGRYDGMPHAINATSSGIGNVTFEYSLTYSETGAGYTQDLGQIAKTDVTGSPITVYIRYTNDSFDGVGTTSASINISKMRVNPKLNIQNVTQRPFDNTKNVSGAYIEFENADAGLGALGQPNIPQEAYIANYEFEKATAENSKVFAKNIVITDAQILSNYELLADNCEISHEGLICPATPLMQEASIVFDELSEASKTYADLNLRVDPAHPFLNSTTPNLTVAGIIKILDRDSLNELSQDDPIRKNTQYIWRFEPNDKINYTNTTGEMIFWSVPPITELEVGGITQPVANQMPVTPASIFITSSTPSAVVKATEISWRDDKGYLLSPGESFGYNRVYTVSVKLLAQNDDRFSTSENEAGFYHLREVEITLSDGHNTIIKGFSSENIANDTVTASFTFPNTEKGTFDGSEFSLVPYTGFYDGDEHTITTSQAIEGISLTYATSFDGAYTPNIPKFKDVGTYTVYAKATHEDYNDYYISSAIVTITPKQLIPQVDASLISPRYYDAESNVIGGKIILEGIIGDDEVGASGSFAFSNPNVEIQKTVIASDIVISGRDSYNYALSSNGATKTNCGGLIQKATPMVMPTSIVFTEIKSTKLLSEIDLATDGAIFANATVPNLTLSGILKLTSDGAIMSQEELETTSVERGKSYEYVFIPDLEFLPNYTELRGSIVLWSAPQSTGGSGGGGGGGASAGSAIGGGTDIGAVLPDDIIAIVEETQNGILVEYRENGVIYTVLIKDKNSIKGEKYIAVLDDENAQKALESMQGANVLVDQNGTPQVLSLIKDGMIIIRTEGEGAFRLENRKKSFSDTKEHWASANIEFCAVRDLLKGSGDGSFEPEANVTRAMATAMFYRLEQEPRAEDVRDFADIQNGSWYYDAVSWAGGQGIVTGIGTKNFAPDWSITREQLAVMIYNYARICLGVSPIENADISMYGDRDNISEWAYDAISFCTKSGLMKGQENTGFYPTRTATRAELAVVLQRLIECTLTNGI